MKEPTEINRIRLAPDEILLVRMPNNCSPDDFGRAAATFAHYFGIQAKVVIMTDDVKFNVIKKSE